ncbi:hypothetical protein [Shewanella algae]|uniref:hypothetical protein n=1 Tax=Shewanella algae TaxID=38313 RepID=UPI0031F5D22F
MMRVPVGCLEQVQEFIRLYRSSVAEPFEPNDVFWAANGLLSKLNVSKTPHVKSIDKDGQTDWVGKK